MKLGYVYDVVYPRETDGVQKHIWDISRRPTANHNIHWYGLHHWDGPEIIDREGATLHSVGKAIDPHDEGRQKTSIAVLFAARLFSQLLRADFDVIDCQAFPYFPGFPNRLFAGRFIPEKDLILVVDTVEALLTAWPSHRCWMVGEEPELSRVETATERRELKSSIELPGFSAAWEDVVGVMKTADAFGLPSRRERFGIAVLKALACGRLVVTFCHQKNAATELVSDGETGRVVDIGPTQLTTAVRGVQSLLSAASIKDTTDYEWDAVAKQSDAVSREVC